MAQQHNVCKIAQSSLYSWTATLLALVTAKHFSELTLLCIDNQHLFLQHHTAIFISTSGGKRDYPGHLPPQICIESHSNINLCPIFIWRLISGVLNLLGWSLMDHLWPFSFLGNNRQHRPVSAKTISSWVRKVLCVTKSHMSLGSLCGAAALVAGVSLVSILQAGDWARVSTPARQYFSPYITTTD